MNIEEIKMDHFESFDELIRTCKMWIRDDDIDAYYRFFEFNCMKTLVTAYEKEKGENVKLRLQDIPLMEGELKAYKDRVNELKQELEKEKEKNKELSDKLTEKICKGVEEEILEEYRQVIIDKNKIIEELKKYKK